MLRLIGFAKDTDIVGDTLTYAFAVMPDHCHWVLQLGERLTLGQLVAKFKTLSMPALAACQLAWQRNYYEHQLRPEEAIEDYALYVFLNPYRVNLLTADQPWPGWWSGTPEFLRFWGLRGPNGGPQPEWIDHPIPPGLAAGE